VANVPSRAATAHSITVPLQRYELHRPVTKEGTDGALFFPIRSQCQFDKPVERHFAERLEKLPKYVYPAGATSRSGARARYPTSLSCSRVAASSDQGSRFKARQYPEQGHL